MALKYDWLTLGELAEQAARSRAANEARTTLGIDLPSDAALHAAVAELLAGGIGGGGGGPVAAGDVTPGTFQAGAYSFPNAVTIGGQTVDNTTMLTAAQKSALTGGGSADGQHTHATFGAVTFTGLVTLNGGVQAQLTLVTKTANYTATASDQIILVDASAGPVTITLPLASAFGVKELFLKKIDTTTNAVTIAAQGADTVDTVAAITLATSMASADLVADGASKWWQALAGAGAGGGSITAADVGPGTFPVGSFDFPDGTGAAFHVHAQATLHNAVTFSNQVAFSSHHYGKYFNAGNGGSAITVNVVNGNYQKITLNSTTACVLSFSGIAAGGRYLLKLVQDATGNRLVTWPANTLWASGTAPTLSTAPNKTDLIELFYDGANLFGRVWGIGY